MIIHPLFPEPIYFSNLERKLTKREFKVVNEYKKKTYKNEGNTTSNETYVLDNKALKNLKEDLYKMIVDYFDKIVCTHNPIIPYITQSWLNYTETDQFHHRHSHPNSYVSGVFYINADEKVDYIKFFKPEKTIEFHLVKYNIFNSTAWKYAVKTGDVILFPSYLRHGVDRKRGPDTRISLSFNVFFKGKIGVTQQLTELVMS